MRQLALLMSTLLLTSPALGQKAFEPYDIPTPRTSLTYTMLEAQQVGNNRVEVIYRATGTEAGDLFVRRLIDCNAPRFQPKGSSKTLEGLKTSKGFEEWLIVSPGHTDEAVYRASCQRLMLMQSQASRAGNVR